MTRMSEEMAAERLCRCDSCGIGRYCRPGAPCDVVAWAAWPTRWKVVKVLESGDIACGGSMVELAKGGIITGPLPLVSESDPPPLVIPWVSLPRLVEVPAGTVTLPARPLSADEVYALRRQITEAFGVPDHVIGPRSPWWRRWLQRRITRRP